MWKDIKNYEGYYKVSNTGLVKSIPRNVPNGSSKGKEISEHILKPHKSKNGYLQVTLCVDRIKRVYYVHRLVAEAFIENPLGLSTVNHKDGDKTNNNVTNLEFLSYSANNQHAYDTGLHGKNENHYRAKLTTSQVIEIKKRGKYDTYEAIAQNYGVSKATVRDILAGKTWSNI